MSADEPVFGRSSGALSLHRHQAYLSLSVCSDSGPVMFRMTNEKAGSGSSFRYFEFGLQNVSGTRDYGCRGRAGVREVEGALLFKSLLVNIFIRFFLFFCFLFLRDRSHLSYLLFYYYEEIP